MALIGDGGLSGLAGNPNAQQVAPPAREGNGPSSGGSMARGGERGEGVVVELSAQARRASASPDAVSRTPADAGAGDRAAEARENRGAEIRERSEREDDANARRAEARRNREGFDAERIAGRQGPPGGRVDIRA
ncbi:MAG: hypothetical protein ACE5ED_02695 [Rhodothalassiaceae bacterium]